MGKEKIDMQGTEITLGGKVYRTLEAVVYRLVSQESMPEDTSGLGSVYIDENLKLYAAAGDLSSYATKSELETVRSALAGRIDDAEDDINSLEDDMTQAKYDIGQNAGNISSLGTSKQDKHTTLTVTLTSADWIIDSTQGFNQVVSVLGVKANNLIQVSPAIATIDDYLDASIYCSAQALGTLTFHTDDATPPASDVQANVVIWD